MEQTFQPDNTDERILLRNTTYYSTGGSFCRADIVVYEDRIEKILPPCSLLGDESLDASNLLILPGLVNAHLHPSKELYGGLKAYCEISEILGDVHQNNRLETEELQSLASYYSLLRGVRQGVTTFGIFTSRAHIDVKQAIKAGIRAVVHYSQNDQWLGAESKPDYFSRKKIIQNYLNCAAQHESDLIKIHPATASELSASPELMRSLHEIATQQNKKFAMHICEGRSQVAQCVAYYGKTGVQLLNSYDLLDEQTLLIHASHLSQEDISLLSGRQLINFIHCPVSNSFAGSGKFPYKTLSHHCVGLGTDAAMVNPFNKLSFDAAFSLYFHGESNLAEKVKVDSVVDSITKRGAEALGISELGCIEEGMLADLCFYKANTLDMGWKDPSLVFLSTVLSHSPTHVMINGKFVVFDDLFLNCDFETTKYEFIKNKTVIQ